MELVLGLDSSQGIDATVGGYNMELIHGYQGLDAIVGGFGSLVSSLLKALVHLEERQLDLYRDAGQAL